MGKQRRDETGNRYGKLVVSRPLVTHKYTRSWFAVCDCGSPERTFDIAHLRCGDTKSCGCIRRAKGKAKATYKHGMVDTHLYSVWRYIRTACHNPQSPHYRKYGDKGVTVCDEWRKSFEAFAHDVEGKYKEGYVIRLLGDRKRFEKGSVYFEKKENAGTVIVEIGGERKTLFGWCKERGMSPNTVYKRITNGWTIERSITTPIRKRKKNRKK